MQADIELAPLVEPIPFDQAWLYCLTLNYNNHKDWRLPTRKEYTDTGLIGRNYFDQNDIHNSGDPSCRLGVCPVRDIK